MAVRRIDPDMRLGSRRGGVVVCVLAGNVSADLVDCLRAVDHHTPIDIPVLVCGPAAALGVVESIGASQLAADRELLYLCVGPGGAAPALEIAADADLALLGSDCIAAEHWLEGLIDAANGDSRIATATPLTVASPGDLAIAAAAVRGRSLKLRPLLPNADCSCLYVRRPALELVGGFDPAARSGVRDFSRRCTGNGLTHVLADDVLVCVPGRAAVDVASPEPGPLTRAVSRARRSLRRPSVVIDARIVSSPAPGTRIQVLEMISALARTEKLHLAVLLPSNPGADVARRFEALPDVATFTHADALREAEDRRVDIVHRPFQITNAADLGSLARLGDRLVITHQDLISYFNPSYFSSSDAWQGYRQLTRGVLSIADRVLFFSAHARDDALAEELVEPQRASVVRIGVDHCGPTAVEPIRPERALRLPDGVDVLLSIGTNFRHKNRVFALRMLAELQRRHGWGGYLVLAGPRIKTGSSSAEESQLLASDPRLAEAVIDCGPVTEEEKTWLLRRARLVVYPTVHEGFGLVPFEAASHGVACMWAPGTSLSELLPDIDGGIVSWDATRSAARALDLLRNEGLRLLNVESIRDAGAGLTWDATAAHLIEEYDATCDSAAMPASALERRQDRITGALTEDGMRLVGAGGALPADVERPLLALATHPKIGRPVFGALKLGYRLMHRGGRDHAASPGPRES